ncbi:hypothetical protein KM043_001915 [Ampulex compressa]|nr:hypothetical protein KM043_001915 [Ampulex compressa]
MGALSADYNWGSIKALSATIFSMNAIGIVVVILAVIWAIRLKRGLEDYANLVAPGNDYAWSAKIGLAALVCAPAYVEGVRGYLSWNDEAARPGTRDRAPERDANGPDSGGHDVNRIFFRHALLCLVSGCLVAALNVAHFVRSSATQRGQDSMLEAIRNYGNDPLAKARIDSVQAEMRCCGSESYRDWFDAGSWSRAAAGSPGEEEEEEERGPRLEGQPISRVEEDRSVSLDVPFSCCSNDVPKPCVHHDVSRPSSTYDYDPKRNLTISTIGCREKILRSMRVVGYFLNGFFSLLCVYQVALATFARLLQTAHSDELYIGPKKSRYRAWIFRASKGSAGDEPLLDRRRKRFDGGARRANPRGGRSARAYSDRGTSKPSEGERGKRFLTKIRSTLLPAKSRSAPIFPSALLARLGRLQRRRTVARRAPSNAGREDRVVYRAGEMEEAEEETGFTDDERTLGNASDEDSSSVESLPSPPPLPSASETRGGADGLREVPLGRSATSVRATVSAASIHRAESPSTTFADNRAAAVRSEEEARSAKEDASRIVRRRLLERFERIDGPRRKDEEDPGKLVRDRSTYEPEDFYDRFRGSLQHTLARREAIGGRTKEGTGVSARGRIPRVPSEGLERTRDLASGKVVANRRNADREGRAGNRSRLLATYDPDVYDRFRGSSQRALARREAIGGRIRRAVKTSPRIYEPRITTSIVAPRKGHGDESRSCRCANLDERDAREALSLPKAGHAPFHSRASGVSKFSPPPPPLPAPPAPSPPPPAEASPRIDESVLRGRSDRRCGIRDRCAASGSSSSRDSSPGPGNRCKSVNRSGCPPSRSTRPP